jgi:hypothetical protein
MAIPFSDICRILAEFYIREKEDQDFGEFFKYNDIGLPLAYLVASDLATPSEKGEEYITQTWEMFSGALKLEETEIEFKTYTEILEFLADKE